MDEPTKIFGPDLENILNRAGFYKKREWVGLTHDEISSFPISEGLIYAIEAKLKEKNGG